jgi:hypothetical protein
MPEHHLPYQAAQDGLLRGQRLPLLPVGVFLDFGCVDMRPLSDASAIYMLGFLRLVMVTGRFRGLGPLPAG